MNELIQIAESWWALYAIHMVELSVFITLIWAVDQWARLDTRLRYFLWLLPLVKAFVPPFYSVPIPDMLGDQSGVIIQALEGTPFVYTPQATIDPAAFFVPNQALPLSVWLFSIWVLSAGAVCCIAIWRNRLLWRSLRYGRLVHCSPVLAQLLGDTGIKVFTVRGVNTPLLVGVVQPRLYLPTDWESWDDVQLRGVVTHELAHYHNRDLWVLSLQVVVTALFGLNPLVWLLNRRLIYLRELRCDEYALAQSELLPVDYGKLLYTFLDSKPLSRLPALGFNDQPKTLKKRLEHVLDYQAGADQRFWWQWCIGVCMVLAILPISMREAYLDFRYDHVRWVTLNSVEVFNGRNLALHLDTVSERGQQVIQENHVKIRLIVRDVLQQVGQNGEPINLYGGLNDVLQDQINLVLGRQWVIQVHLEEMPDRVTSF